MDGTQFSRSVLTVSTTAGIGALLCLAKPCWQAGAIEALLLICIPALAWSHVVRSVGRMKDWWTGVALECTAAIPLFWVLYVQYWRAPFTSGPFTSFDAQTSLFLFNLSDRFPSLLLACAPAPTAGILYAMLRAPLAASIARGKASLARWKADRAANPRRWFQFSLRTVSLLLVVMMLWFGMILNEAREQREAVKALESLDWTVQYDWQKQFSFSATTPWLAKPLAAPTQNPWEHVYFRSLSKPPLTAAIHVDAQNVFHNVEKVYFVRKGPQEDPTIRRSIPFLQRLPRLQSVQMIGVGSVEVMDELKAALPHCQVN